jgi:hypothetical protein
MSHQKALLASSRSNLCNSKQAIQRMALPSYLLTVSVQNFLFPTVPPCIPISAHSLAMIARL